MQALQGEFHQRTDKLPIAADRALRYGDAGHVASHRGRGTRGGHVVDEVRDYLGTRGKSGGTTRAAPVSEDGEVRPEGTLGVVAERVVGRVNVCGEPSRELGLVHHRGWRGVRRLAFERHRHGVSCPGRGTRVARIGGREPVARMWLQAVRGSGLRHAARDAEAASERGIGSRFPGMRTTSFNGLPIAIDAPRHSRRGCDANGPDSRWCRVGFRRKAESPVDDSKPRPKASW